MVEGLAAVVNLTKFVPTHDLDLVLDLCDRTIAIHYGRVTADGPTLEIFGDEALLSERQLEKPLRLQGCPACGGQGGMSNKSQANSAVSG